MCAFKLARLLQVLRNLKSCVWTYLVENNKVLQFVKNLFQVSNIPTYAISQGLSRISNNHKFWYFSVNLYSLEDIFVCFWKLQIFFACCIGKKVKKMLKMSQNAKTLYHQQLLPNQTYNNHDIWYFSSRLNVIQSINFTICYEHKKVRNGAK